MRAAKLKRRRVLHDCSLTPIERKQMPSALGHMQRKAGYSSLGTKHWLVDLADVLDQHSVALKEEKAGSVWPAQSSGACTGLTTSTTLLGRDPAGRHLLCRSGDGRALLGWVWQRIGVFCRASRFGEK